MRRSVPEGIRITKAGLWFVLLTLVVGATGTNTGNSALYMVFASMLGLLLVSGVLSQQNVRSLEVEIEPPAVLHAGRPSRGRVRLFNRSRMRARWLLRVAPVVKGSPAFVARLGARETIERELDLMFARRGRHRLEGVRVTSPFPLGFFQKGLRYRVDDEVLVYPEIYDRDASRGHGADLAGDMGSRRRGWGHELRSLRPFRSGDDPRSIHWKRTARTGELVFWERESERTERIAIVLDNAIGAVGEAAEPRAAAFERLVSEAASIAVDGLDRGLEVSLRTRDESLEFARGSRQRDAILEALALVEPRPQASEPLLPEDPGAPHIVLTLDPTTPTALRGRRS